MQMKDGHVESWKEQEKRVSIRVTTYRKSRRKRNLEDRTEVVRTFRCEEQQTLLCEQKVGKETMEVA